MSDSYYLYAKKETRTLSDLRVSIFELSKAPVPNSIVVTYNGLGYDSWLLNGNELHFVHCNPLEWRPLYLSLYSNADHRAHMEKGILPDLTVAVRYTYLTWNGATRQFDETTTTESFTRANHEKGTYYKFFQAATSSQRTAGSSTPWKTHKSLSPFTPRYAPVVVTDDNVEYYDKRGYSNEVAVDTSAGTLVFNPQENLLTNPGLEIISGGNAFGWTKRNSSGAVIPASVIGGSTSVYGDYHLRLNTGETLHQTARLRSLDLHRVSFYGRVEGGDDTIRLVINPVDLNGNYRDSSNNTAGTPYDSSVQIFTTDFQGSADDWRRYEAVVGESTEYFSHNDPPFASDVVVNILPASTTSLELRVVAAGARPIRLDALQLHKGGETAPFLGITGDATVEYESDPDGVYQTSPSSTAFLRDNVNTDPLRSQKPDGFLAFYAMGSSDDWQLKRGSDLMGTAGQMTSVLGRYHLPYARTSGIGKLHERQAFHNEGWSIDDELEPLITQVAASEAEELPPENSYTDLSGKLHFLTKQTKYTPLVSMFYDQFDNPLASTDVVVTQLGSAETVVSSTYTDEGGRARFYHRPLVTSGGVGTEKVTFSVGNVTAIFWADVEL